MPQHCPQNLSIYGLDPFVGHIDQLSGDDHEAFLCITCAEDLMSLRVLRESGLNKLNFIKFQNLGLFKSKSNLAVNDYIPK